MKKIRINQNITLILLVFILSFTFTPLHAFGEKIEDPYGERQYLFEKMESLFGIPWYYLAAIDQYERSIAKVRKDIPVKEGLIAIYIPPSKWTGFLNPNPNDVEPKSIQFFNGMGLDGNGDGLADPKNDLDVLFTMTQYLSSYGFKEEDIRIALWEYYKREKTVEQISQFAKIYQKFDTIFLTKQSFPISKGLQYSYRSTWGDARGWGGRRMHEGTDIFASYGTPVKSVCYGYVEVMGWNIYGGWRVGIRGLDNIYYYYAHLAGFEKSMRIGDIVEPGQIIGYVGSSGYGKPGTQGKFPPHLHFGMYIDNGRTEWAFDPYPYLRKWERQRK
ncbi:M23 family metallopeptidase [Microaerobacter geothermalis]|uniref:M23 family metallopeptidase n=1 Tax=Microaerobacter geothermalis TaxID=674972 RepID=UPI001F161FD8|nr:M23 family metallopeptidase [Microaerobacter geothermalis]MCF6092401.1 M23 family metallopeptidase [Microaerobacter geothermalis]